MMGKTGVPAVHPAGEPPAVELAADEPVAADTFAGRVRLEWEPTAPVTTMGQLAFFIEYLKQGGLFDGWVAGCPLHLTSPNAPAKRDVLGTVLLSVLAGHWRYAHITALRADAVNAPPLGMKKVVSEDAVRRGLGKIDETAGIAWLREQLEYCVRPFLGEPWILDVDTTVKPLYGHQQAAEVGYNPAKRGRPLHVYHSYLMAELRLVLEVEVASGKEHTAAHAAPGLWALLDRLGPACAPTLLRGDNDWGNEAVMGEAERRGQPYLFKLRRRRGVKRVLERAMLESDWQNAGAGWQGKWGEVRLLGWSRQRRVVLLRRRLRQSAADRAFRWRRAGRGQSAAATGLCRIGRAPGGVGIRRAGDLAGRRAAHHRPALSRPRRCREQLRRIEEPMGLGRFHHPRRQTLPIDGPHRRARRQLVEPVRPPGRPRPAPRGDHQSAAAAPGDRPADPACRPNHDHHHQPHGEHHRAFLRIAGFFARLRQTAEQLTDLDRWYRILSYALIKYLKGRQLDPPRRLQPA